MIADEEGTGGARGGRRGRGAADGEADASEAVGVADEGAGNEKVEEDAEEREGEAEREPEQDEEGDGGVGPLDQAAVVEDDERVELLRRDTSGLRVRRNHVSFLHAQMRSSLKHWQRCMGFCH